MLGRNSGTFDDCKYKVETEGAWLKGKAKVIGDSLHVIGCCKLCKSDVYDVSRSDLKTRIVENVRIHFEEHGVSGQVDACYIDSEPAYCTKCAKVGTIRLIVEATDKLWKELQFYRLFGHFTELYGGLVEIDVKVYGARFYPRRSVSIQCKCNNRVAPDHTPKAFGDFCAGVSRYLQDGADIPEPVEFEEVLLCPHCLNRPKLVVKLNAKIPQTPNEFARSVMEWQRRQPLYARTAEQVEAEG